MKSEILSVCLFAGALLVLFEPSAWATPRTDFPFPTAGEALLGQVRHRTLKYEDTFARVARAEEVGFDALEKANPHVDKWLPGEGTEILIPSSVLLPDVPRSGVVVNLSEMKLFHFEEDAGRVAVYPIGIGSEGRETPLMQTRVVAKLQDPTWYPPASIRERHARNGDILPAQVPPGPDNPLGPYAIQLAVKGYFIHGTNQPIGVGQRVSSGCIRMYNPHIEELVHRVANGTVVTVIRQPYKVAWHAGALYLEAHPRWGKGLEHVDHSGFVAQIIRATKQRQADIDWDLAFATAQAARGLPVRISR